MNALATKVTKLYALELKVLEYAKSPLLLAVRLYWGWQFFQTGTGKLENVEAVTRNFVKWGVPFPHLNVYMAGTTEAVGGLFLLAGLGGRIATIPLIFTMLVAYATAHRDVLGNIWSNPDDVVSAAPFLFLYTAVLVLVFGPGTFSLDHLIGWWLGKRSGAPATAATSPAPALATSPKTA